MSHLRDGAVLMRSFMLDGVSVPHEVVEQLQKKLDATMKFHFAEAVLRAAANWANGAGAKFALTPEGCLKAVFKCSDCSAEEVVSIPIDFLAPEKRPQVVRRTGLPMVGPDEADVLLKRIQELEASAAPDLPPGLAALLGIGRPPRGASPIPPGLEEVLQALFR